MFLNVYNLEYRGYRDHKDREEEVRVSVHVYIYVFTPVI